MVRPHARPAALPTDRAVDRSIDLNADVGEEVTDDVALVRIVTSANVACGYHAGTPAIMRAVCEQAVELAVSVGAQVSYDDREGFGRQPRDVPQRVLREQVADQVGTLVEIARSAGTQVRYVKPHGALYHRVIDDEEQASAVLDGSGRLAVLGMPGALLRGAVAAGRAVFHEGFPDRGYGPDGRLLARGQPGALLDEPRQVAAQALRLARSEASRIHSLCVHGDHAGAVRHAEAVRRALEADGWRLRGLPGPGDP